MRLLGGRAGPRRAACARNRCTLNGRVCATLVTAVAILVALGLPSSSRAQATHDPSTAATDAFGESAGLEHVGLYNADEIRGFDPVNSGAYRIDGVYYARTSVISGGAVAGVSVRVGANALPMTYPSPSGIVDVHLRSYSPGDHALSVDLNSYAWFSPMVAIDVSQATKSGQAGVAGGLQWLPHVTMPDQSHLDALFIGAVPEWRPSGRVRVRALLSYGRASFDRGSWANIAVGPVLPPVQSTRVLLPPRQAAGSQHSATLGLLSDFSSGDGWRVAAAAVYSEDRLAYDFTSFRYGAAEVHATLTHIPEQTAVARSFEVRVSKDLHFGPADHRFTAAVRYRRREAIDSPATPLDLGLVDAARPAYPPLPKLPDDGGRSHDIVTQRVESLDYAGLYWKRLELRAGVDLTDHSERFEPTAGRASDRQQSFSFPHASVTFRINSRLTPFASYVRGLEDSGVAPTFAVNANAVLPPVLARQEELGFRYVVGENLSLIAAAFDVEKPTTGLRDDGVFTFVGLERHRGVEMSVTGRLTPYTRIVFGAVDMSERLSPLPGAGSIGRHPVGTSPVEIAANLTQNLPWARDWSVDGQLSWRQARYVNTANTLRGPDVTLLDVGLRGKLYLGGRPAMLRVVATNLLNTRAWSVQTSGAIVPVDRPTIWGMLTLNFGA
jgi:iron complex outermembrane receptor protein